MKTTKKITTVILTVALLATASTTVLAKSAGVDNAKQSPVQVLEVDPPIGS